MPSTPSAPPCPPSARASLATSTFAAIDPARCTGCGWCLATCPDQLLAFEVNSWRKQTVLIDRERCDGCGHCAAKCPMGAITMRRKSMANLPKVQNQAEGSVGDQRPEIKAGD